MTRRLRPAIAVLAAVVLAGCAALDTSVQPRPADPASVLYNRALERYQQGDYKKARDLFYEYTGVYQNTPLNIVVTYYLGHCHQMLGDLKEARIMFERVVARGQDDFWGAQAMARIQQIEGNQ